MIDNATPQEHLWVPVELQTRMEVMKARIASEGAGYLNDKVALAYARIQFHNHTTEWGNCSACNGYDRVFFYTQNRRTESNPSADMWEQNHDYQFCQNCIIRKAQSRVCQRDDVSLFEYDDYEYACSIISFGVFTPEDMPLATQPDPIKCVCDRYINERDVREALDSNGDTQKAHSHCVIRCEACEKNYVISGSNRVDFRVVDSRTCCSTCAESILTSGDYSDCDRCNEWFHTDNLNWSEERERDLCNTCYRYPIECRECDYHYTEGSRHQCYRNEGDTIYSYNYKPKPIFFGQGKYHLGFELEVEHTDGETGYANEVAELIERQLRERVYMKWDGSLDSGFEVVTHPHTLEEYTTQFDWSFLSTLVGQNFVSWNNSNCGFHVHISKTAFDTPRGYQAEISHKMRFTKFIYDNQYQVERIAGRKANDYATFSDKGAILNKVLFDDQRDGRYQVVNVYNEHTYEIRIFKGSLRKERLLSNIEFVHAVCEYTRNMKVVAKHTPFAWSKFVKFVTDNDTQYPNLMKIIDEAFASERIKSEV